MSDETKRRAEAAQAQIEAIASAPLPEPAPAAQSLSDADPAVQAQIRARMAEIDLKDSNSKLPEALQEMTVSSNDNELVFRLHREKDPISGVLDALNSNGIAIKDLSTREPGLEEVFINLTGKDND